MMMRMKKLIEKVAKKCIGKPPEINKNILTVKPFETDDTKALAADWHAVGNDLKNVMYGNTKKRKKNTRNRNNFID